MRTAPVLLAFCGSLALLGACKKSPALSGSGCFLHFNGNETLETAEGQGCVSFVPSETGWSLRIASPVTGTAAALALTTLIDVGQAPGRGVFSPETSPHWSAVAFDPEDHCRYSAGDLSAPSGGFTLTLTSVRSDGGTPLEAHGRLHVDQAVHAPEKIDCGAGDTESVDVEF